MHKPQLLGTMHQTLAFVHKPSHHCKAISILVTHKELEPEVIGLLLAPE